jgi:hypothetical protein
MAQINRIFNVDQRNFRDSIELIFNFNPDVKVLRKTQKEGQGTHFDKLELIAHIPTFQNKGYVEAILRKKNYFEKHETSQKNDKYDSINNLKDQLNDMSSYILEKYLSNFSVDFQNLEGEKNSYFFNFVGEGNE